MSTDANIVTRMADQNIQFLKKWQVSRSNPIYFCSVGDLTRDPFGEVIALDYTGQLVVYNNKGKDIFKMPFSADVTALFGGDLFGSGEKVLVSMDLNGYVRAFAIDGREIWKVKLPASIILGAVDFYPNQPAHIACVLETNEIDLLDPLGKVIMSCRHNTAINGCTFASLRDAMVVEIVFVDTNDHLGFLDFSGKLSTVDLPIKNVKGIAPLRIFDTTFLAIIDERKGFAVINGNGEVIGQEDLRETVRCFATGSIFSRDCDGIVASLDNALTAFEIIPVIPGNFIGAPRRKKHVQADWESSSDKFRVIAHSENAIENSALKCPDCGHYQPALLRQQLLNAIDTFCENCGYKFSSADLRSGQD